MGGRDSGGRGGYGRNDFDLNNFFNWHNKDWQRGDVSRRNKGKEGGRRHDQGKGRGRGKGKTKRRDDRHNSVSGYNSWNDGDQWRFNKFKDHPAPSSMGNNFGRAQRFEPHMQNDSKLLDPPVGEQDTGQLAIGLKEPSEDQGPGLLRNIKTEKPDTGSSSPKPQANKNQVPEPDTSFSSDIRSDEKQNPVLNVHIKQERSPVVEKKRTAKDPPPVVEKPVSQSTETEESSSTSSSESSSDEEEIPKMPHPIKAAETPKLKKEKTIEKDVVCLGKLSNIENLVDEDESEQGPPCIICQNIGHSAPDCNMKCTRCSHTSYEYKMTCKNCGEIYPNNSKSLPRPPNPLVMFMQFMQFCMSQYFSGATDAQNPLLQIDSTATAPAKPSTEKSQKDKAKKQLKRKSDAIRTRKRSHNENDSDSEPCSKVTSSKKHKKHAKTSVREPEMPQVPSQQQLPPFIGQFPGTMPFAGAFNAPAFNPMLAFSQIMGYNPNTMNFTR